MATLPKTDVVFVGFGMVGGIIANELGKATGLQMVALERGPLRSTNPDFLMDHFDEWRYAVQGQLFQDLNRETWTFRNNSNQTALPVRQYGSWLPGNGVGGGGGPLEGAPGRGFPPLFSQRHAPVP